MFTNSEKEMFNISLWDVSLIANLGSFVNNVDFTVCIQYIYDKRFYLKKFISDITSHNLQRIFEHL